MPSLHKRTSLKSVGGDQSASSRPKHTLRDVLTKSHKHHSALAAHRGGSAYRPIRPGGFGQDDSSSRRGGGAGSSWVGDNDSEDGDELRFLGEASGDADEDNSSSLMSDSQQQAYKVRDRQHPKGASNAEEALRRGDNQDPDSS